jgi:DNA-binding protein HU-beta
LMTLKQVLKEREMAEKSAMTKSQLSNHIAELAGITKKTANEILDELAAVAYKEAKRSKQFTIPGIGKLVLSRRKARIGRNPATGAEIKIPAKKVVKFRVAKACKDAVLGE